MSTPPDRRRIIGRHIPMTQWLPAYPREWLRPDLLSALSSWGVMVPVALAYASLAGMPPSVGIVTAMVALTAYAILGTSRHLKVTASSTMAVMSLAVVTHLAAGDPALFISLTATLAFIVGLLLLVAGLLRLGFLSEFLAKPVVTGFILGVSITILVGLVHQLPETNPWDLAMGGGALVLILVLRHIDRRIPAPLVALLISIPLVTLLELTTKGVDVVGPVPTGVPFPTLPTFPLGNLFFLLTGVAGLVFLANEVESRVLSLVEAADPRPATVVLDIGATSDLDVTTADMLLELLRALTDLGVGLNLAQAKGPVRERMRRIGIMDAIGEDHVFTTVPMAVDAATRADRQAPVVPSAGPPASPG